MGALPVREFSAMRPALRDPHAISAFTDAIFVQTGDAPSLSSTRPKIAELGRQVRKVWLFSKRHEWHWRNHPSFSKILDPKRMKLAFADEIASKQWHNELDAIILEVTAKSLMGSSDDGQEVGKGH
jgi:hypothetical protein